MPSDAVSQSPARAVRWTPEQRRAIYERGKEILVSAAAGSGKTSVLVERIIRRVLDPDAPVDLDRLLVVTFTENAAGEMKERIRHSLEAAAQEGGAAGRRAAAQLRLMGRTQISTLHAFCLQLVRRFFYLVDLDPRFRLMDEEEATLLKLGVLDEVFETSYRRASSDADFASFKAFAQRYGGRRDDASLRRVTVSLHEYLQSIPDGLRWLEEAEKAYERGSAAWERAVRAWEKSHLIEAAVSVEDATALLTRAVAIAGLPDGPATYAPSFHVALEGLQSAAQAIASGEWDACARAVASIEWPRLKSPKDCDVSLREEASALWDGAKKVVRVLQRELFSRPLAEQLDDVTALRPMIGELARLVRRYDEALTLRKRELGLLDFSDLERIGLQILESPSSPARAECQQRFDEVLVDEYQDINPVQDRLLALVSREETAGNRFMVGDVKQSIYGFRLADPRIFLTHQNRFGDPDSETTCRIDLSANYRSRPSILTFVNFLFQQVMHPELAEMSYDERARLIPGREADGDGAAVEVHLLETSETDIAALLSGMSPGEGASRGPAVATGEMSSGRVSAPLDSLGDEANDDAASDDGLEWVDSKFEKEAVVAGRLIGRLVAEGYRYRDIAVLMRAPRNRAGTLVEILERMGIPAYSQAGAGFFKAVEVELILSLLRLCDNPLDDIALAGVLRSPVVGLDEAQLLRMRAHDRSVPFHEAVMAYAKSGEDETADRVRLFLARLDAWRTAARRLPLSKLIHLLYEETGYVEFASALPAGARREANLRALYRRAADFDRDGAKGLRRFIEHIDLLDEAGQDVAPPAALSEGEDVVQVLSVHRSKGLEYPVVILLGADHGWNKDDTRGDLLFHKDLGLALSVVDREKRVRYPSLPLRAIVLQKRRDALAEEMRLLYVALTRAKERLLIIGAVSNLESRAAKWSGATRQKGWLLPLEALTRARSWLDWIGAAIARHRDGGAIRSLGAGELGADYYAPEEPEVENFAMSVDVHLYGDLTQVPETVAGADGSEPPDAGFGGDPDSGFGPGFASAPDSGADTRFAGDSDLGSATRSPGLPGLGDVKNEATVEAEMETLDRLYRWEYPHRELTRTPAKMSVTELARRFAEDEEAEEAPFARSSQTTLTRRGTDGADPRQRGIATHTFLAKCDFRSGVDAAALFRQRDLLVDRGFLTDEEARLVDLEAISRFLSTPIGQRIVRAEPGQLWRELPFTMRLAPAESATIVQGAIDVLLRVGDRYVIVDYKTDRVKPGEEAGLAQTVYGRQVSLYREFVRTLTQASEIDAYLVFLHTGALVEVTGTRWDQPSSVEGGAAVDGAPLDTPSDGTGGARGDVPGDEKGDPETGESA